MRCRRCGRGIDEGKEIIVLTQNYRWLCLRCLLELLREVPVDEGPSPVLYEGPTDAKPS